VTEHLYCPLLSSASKGKADCKDDFWLKKDIFLRGGENSHPPTHPNQHVLNNLCIVVRGKQASAWFGAFFFPALFSNATPLPADSAQPQGCCCLPSYNAQGGIFILAISEQFSPEGQQTASSPDPIAALIVFKVPLQTMGI